MIFFSCKLGKKAKIAPIPNCQTLNGERKNIACWGTEAPFEIKNKVKLNEKIETIITAISLKFNDLKNLKIIYRKIG